MGRPRSSGSRGTARPAPPRTSAASPARTPAAARFPPAPTPAAPPRSRAPPRTRLVDSSPTSLSRFPRHAITTRTSGSGPGGLTEGPADRGVRVYQPPAVARVPAGAPQVAGRGLEQAAHLAPVPHAEAREQRRDAGNVRAGHRGADFPDRDEVRGGAGEGELV